MSRPEATIVRLAPAGLTRLADWLVADRLLLRGPTVAIAAPYGWP